jgi:hypothetical protein
MWCPLVPRSRGGRSANGRILANFAAILGGILVFGEPVGSDAVGIIARLLAFGLVIAGAGLVPAPLRAHTDISAEHTDAS